MKTIYNILAIAFLFPLLCLAQEKTQTSYNQQPIPLEKLVNKDGTLNVKSGLNGSLDLTGWQMQTGPNGEPRFIKKEIQSTNTEVPQGYWDDQFDFIGIAGRDVYAVAVIGGILYVGGNFGAAGDQIANGIAKWDGSRWSSLGQGVRRGTTLRGRVWAFKVVGTDLYVGGDFHYAGEISANNIAKWDGTNWSALGSGTDRLVRAIEIIGSDLYVGGDFHLAGGTSAMHIAKWNGSSWSALGLGTYHNVYALAAIGMDLYVGGYFIMAGSISANYIAKWDGTNWSALGSGTNRPVRALAVIGTELYAGGDFYIAGGSSISRIAKWDGSSWSALGTGLNNDVYALLVVGTDLYACGSFSTAGGASALGIAKWNGSSWSSLGGEERRMFALTSDGLNLYLGGGFQKIGGINADCIAMWNGSNWTGFYNSGSYKGLNRDVWALAVIGSDVYVGGTFHLAGGISVNHIAKWNGSNWSDVGGGTNGDVSCFVVSGADLYVGGAFWYAGGVEVKGVAKWDGFNWSSIGNATDGAVQAIAIAGTDLYIGGYFSSVEDTIEAQNIAKWNGINWEALGAGLDDYVTSLVMIDSVLYAGGNFNYADTLNVNYIAKWDVGKWWSLGSGMDDYVTSIANIGTNLYVGGNFTTAGGVIAAGIARWDGENWFSLETGEGTYANTLKAIGTTLYMGGYLISADGSTANTIGLWDGSLWSSLPMGSTNGEVLAIDALGSDIYFGGSFTVSGQKISSHIARWIGNVWTSTVSGTSSFLYSVSVVNERVAWTGGTGGVVLKTTDGGDIWQSVTSLPSDVHNIVAINSDTVLACVNIPDITPTDARIYRTVNGGNSWSLVHQRNETHSFYNAVFMFDNNEGFALGDPVGGYWDLLMTTDCGLTWSPGALIPQEGSERSISNCFQWWNRNIGWFTSSDSRVYHTKDGGANWSFSATPGPNNIGPSFVTSKIGLIGTGPEGSRDCAITSDGGLSWTSTGVIGAGLDFPAGIGIPTPRWWIVSGNRILQKTYNDASITTNFTAPHNYRHIALKYFPASEEIVGYAVGDSGQITKITEAVALTSISGLAFNDINGDGIKSVGDTAQGGWIIAITNSSGTFLDSIVTNSNGEYTFPALPLDTYIISEAVSSGWMQTYPTGLGTHIVTISIGSEISGINFGNIYGYQYIGPGTGNWSDALSWLGGHVPDSTNIVIIPPAVTVTVDSLPNDSIKALKISGSGKLTFTKKVPKLKIGGTILLEAQATLEFPVDSDTTGLIIYGDFVDKGKLEPGSSKITFKGNQHQTIYAMEKTAEPPYTMEQRRIYVDNNMGTNSIANDNTFTSFYTLEIDGDSTFLLGKIAINNRLTLSKNLIPGPMDTIYIASADTAAIQDTGIVINGTIKRNIASGPTGIYRFESPNTYIQMNGYGTNPIAVSMTVMPNYLSQYLLWEKVDGTIDTVNNTITVDSVKKFSKWPFGIPRPTSNQKTFSNQYDRIDPVDRLYSIRSEGGDNFTAQLRLRYDQSEIPPSASEYDMVLFRGPYFADTVQGQWNMISLPLIPNMTQKDSLFPTSTSSAFSYIGTYEERTNLAFGSGYWLKFASAQQVIIEGDDRDSIEIPVNEGWNMVGMISYPIAVNSVTSIPSNIINSNFFGYGTSYQIEDSLKPLHSYWMKIGSSGKLILSATQVGSFAKGSSSKNELNKYNTLDISDVNGNTQRLYFGCRGNVNRTDLPPIPPKGIFDVRYLTGKYLAVTDKQITEYPIQISSAEYPIRIKWELKDENQLASLLINGKEVGLSRTGLTEISNPQSEIKLRLGSALSKEIPKEFALYQNYPNPFNPITTIKYQLPSESKVTLKVYNILGQIVATLSDEIQPEGYKSVEWNASGIASAVYLYRIEATSISNPSKTFTQVKKMLLLK